MSDTDRQLESLRSSTIMMVDDEPTTLEVVRVILQGEGYRNFVTTSDSTEALALLGREKPDVLLLDLIMPNVSGLDVLRSMRSEEALRYIPAVILTSSTDSEIKLKALELGATDFLSKPVDPSELALRLQNTLAAKAYQDRLSYYDGLTGLPNRRLFLDLLDRVLQRAESMSGEFAVLHMDLDRFKRINDTLGPSAGDALLKATADRIEESVRRGDLLGSHIQDESESALSRIAGDEVSFVLSGVGAVDRAARVAQRILACLSEPFKVDGQDLFISASVGIALFPHDGRDVETLLGSAGSAMSHAKRGGGNDYKFYNKSLNAESLERLSLENQLQRALDREEMLLHYQPKINLENGRIVGAEALMRWQHPEHGLVPPGKFIPIAEQAGLIVSLGDWALRVACQQAVEWQDAGFESIRMAVNVSSKQFRPGTLLATIEEALNATGLQPNLLVLEVTESLIMENPHEASEILQAIKNLGVSISVDDFGTGYSSLSYLKGFPLDELKVDQSFVAGIPESSDDVAIVSATIALAHSLGLTVVAEGVEKEEQLSFLAERGCDEYQGYLYGKPVEASQWTELFRKDRGGA